MRQDHYTLIIKCIQTGMPAIASELVGALNGIIEKNSQLSRELESRQEETKPESKPEPVSQPAPVAPRVVPPTGRR